MVAKKMQLYVLYDLAYILRTNRPPHCATSSVMCFQRYFGNFLCVVFIHTILLRILGVLGYISILSIFFNSLALVLISGIFILMHQSCEGTGWLKRIWWCPESYPRFWQPMLAVYDWRKNDDDWNLVQGVWKILPDSKVYVFWTLITSWSTHKSWVVLIEEYTRTASSESTDSLSYMLETSME